jgi:hypothetical protein
MERKVEPKKAENGNAEESREKMARVEPGTDLATRNGAPHEA